MAQSNTPRSIYVRPPEYVGAFPFEGELFGRKALAEKLTQLIVNVKDGCVIGIDAPWGEGKTWFGRNWQAQLVADGHKTIYLDAFERDYLEEPFMVLASELISALDTKQEETTAQSLLKSSIKIGKSLLPATAKIGINAVGRIVVGTNDVTGEVEKFIDSLDETLANATEDYIKERLSEADSEKKSVLGFREALTAFAEKQDKPVIFFIDELDRCRPDFSIQLIERVKHFFQVPNLVFVLLLNRQQIERAVQGRYGAGIDGFNYLGKFVHLFFSLPKKMSPEPGQGNAIWSYAWEVLNRYKFDQNREIESFVNQFSMLATSVGLSLRDVEKAFGLLSMVRQNYSNTEYLVWPIILKLKFPEIYSGLITSRPEAHIESLNILGKLVCDRDRLWIREYFYLLHESIAHGSNALSQEQRDFLNRYGPNNRHRDIESMFRYWLGLIDVAIQD